MQLTQFSDIGLRLLMYLASETREFPAITLAEVSKQFNVPRNHLLKVSARLIKAGYVSGLRGRAGGLKLAKAPKHIRMGEVVRLLEGHTELINCEKLECRLKIGCELRFILSKAYDAFFDLLNEHTLEDIVQGQAGSSIGIMQKNFIALYLEKSMVH